MDSLRDEEAVRTGDGLFTLASGNPSVPRWLEASSSACSLRQRARMTSMRDTFAVPPGFAIFISETNDKTHWVEAGHCYERFALQSTALGIRTAMINQPVEVSSLRPQFAAFLGVGSRRPDLCCSLRTRPENAAVAAPTCTGGTGLSHRKANRPSTRPATGGSRCSKC